MWGKQIIQNKRSLILSLLVLLASLYLECQAISTPGYIITTKSDTIYGWVQLSRFDQVTGGLVLKGIEEESFHSRVVFISQEGNRFKTYFPEMLFGFGFTYDSIDYVYQQITIQRKSIFKSERQQYRFMRLLYESTGGSRYKDVEMIQNPVLQINKDEYLKYNTNLFRIKKNSKQTEQKDTLKSL